MGWTLRFRSPHQDAMRLPFILRLSDGDLIMDASVLGAPAFPLRHAWMDATGGATEKWLRHLGVPEAALTQPFDQAIETVLDVPTRLTLVAAARARFLGQPAPSSWPQGLPTPDILGGGMGRQGHDSWQLIEESAHPATYPVGLRLLAKPAVVVDSERAVLDVSLPAGADQIVAGAALLAGNEVLSSTQLVRSESGWDGSLPLYWLDPKDVRLDVFDPRIGVGMPVESRPEAWAALREFAGGYWRAELPDRQQSGLVVLVRNGLGESFEVWPQVNGSGDPAIRRLALVELCCGWFGEELEPGACAVDRALAFAELNDCASAAQAAMGGGVEWLLRASAEAADGSWPQMQSDLRQACQVLSQLVDRPWADALCARGQLLAARPELDAELREVLQPEPTWVPMGLPPTAFDQGSLWVQTRQALLAQDWAGDEPDRPLLAEWWAAEVRR